MRLVLLAALALAPLVACDKPTADSCRKALTNMQHLLGTENLNDSANLEGEVRRCRGGSTKSAVDCAAQAATLDDLKRCEFMQVPAKK